MKSVRFPRKFRVYAPLIALFLVLVFIMPKTAKFTYEYKKGAPWLNETLVAQFDFPILKTESQIQNEIDKAWEEMIPYYRKDQSVLPHMEKALTKLDLGEYSYLKSELAAALNRIYERGVISFQKETISKSGEIPSMVYVQRGKRAERTPVSEIYTEVTAAQVLKNISDSLYDSAGLVTLIQPNLIFDKQTTELVHDDAVDYISPTAGVVKAGQVIISNGEIVTAEVEQLLESYENEYNKSVGYYGRGIYQWISAVLMSLALVVVLFLAIYYCNSRIFEQLNKYLYLLMIFTLSAIAASSISSYSSAYFYMVPFTLV